MPTSPPTRCPEPGCYELTTSGRCETHQRKPWATRSTAWGKGSTRKWRTLRAEVLADEPRCRQCGAKATEVDHVRPLSQGGSRWDRANLQALCGDCHEAKSLTERRRRRRPGRLAP